MHEHLSSLSLPLLLLLLQSSISPRGIPPPMSPSQRGAAWDAGSSLREFVGTGEAANVLAWIVSAAQCALAALGKAFRQQEPCGLPEHRHV